MKEWLNDHTIQTFTGIILAISFVAFLTVIPQKHLRLGRNMKLMMVSKIKMHFSTTKKVLLKCEVLDTLVHAG